MSLRLVVFTLIYTVVLSASSQRLEFKVYDPLQKTPIPNNRVTDIAEDPLGRIWISTEKGLFKYNGQNLHGYFSEPDDSTSLIDDNVRDLLITNKGTLWMTTSYGISKYDLKLDEFRNFGFAQVINNFQSPELHLLRTDKSENLYAVCLQYLLKWDGSKFEMVHKIDFGNISDYVFENDKIVWISGDDQAGLVRLDLEDLSSQTFRFSESDPGSIAHNDIRTLTIQHNKLWIGTYGKGMCSLNLDNFHIDRYPSSDDYDKFIKSSYLDNEGRFWIVDITGLKLYDPIINSFHGYYVENDGMLPNMTSIFQDKNGNYWMTHNPGGLSVRPRPIGFRNFSNNALETWHLSTNNISSVLIDHKGNWWLGNHNEGIDIFDWGSDRPKRLDHGNSSNKLGAGSVLAMHQDTDGQIWIGTYFDGLQRLDPASGEITRFSHDPNNPLGMPGNDVRSIASDKSGNIWLGLHGNGMVRFDPKTEEIDLHNNLLSNLSNDWVFGSLIDNKDRLWVATAHGLSKMDLSGDEFESYFSYDSLVNAIPDNRVLSVSQSDDGTIWVGTNAGLARYNEDTNNFTTIPLGQPKSIFSIIAHQSLIWLGHDRGITMYNPKTNLYRDFTSYDGLQSGGFNIGSATKTDEGELIFGGIEGVTMFRPDQLDLSTEIPDVWISAFQINNQLIQPRSNHVLNQSIEHTEHITLNHEQKILTFDYFASNLLEADKNEYLYKLEGFNDEWISNENETSITYTNLDPGDYTLRIKSRNKDGAWSKREVALDISVLPPFWQTWWFRLLIVTLFFAIVYVLYVLRTKELTLQRDRLQQLADSKTKELEMRNRELMAINQSKSKMMSVLGHDLRGPFMSVMNLSELLKSQHEDLDEIEKNEIVESIHMSSVSIYNLFDNLIKWIMNEADSTKYHPKKSDVIPLVENSIKVFETSLSLKGVNIHFSPPSNPVWANVDPEMIKTVIRNLIGNALKFTLRDGDIFIEITELKDMIEVSVRDTGIGMTEETAENLFAQTPYQSQDGTDGEKGTALGLTLCSDFVKTNKGTIRVTSKPDIGSTFIFTVPAFK
ncbi:MAG: hypothetical protein JXQ90_19475 [Cyclobacteriaceae bacterium]